MGLSSRFGWHSKEVVTAPLWHQKMQKVIEFNRCKGLGSQGTNPILLSQESLKMLGGHGTPMAHGMGFNSVPFDSQIGYFTQHSVYSRFSWNQRNGLEKSPSDLSLPLEKPVGPIKWGYRLKNHNLKCKLNKIMLFTTTHLYIILILFCTFREWRIWKCLFLWTSQPENVLMLKVRKSVLLQSNVAEDIRFLIFRLEDIIMGLENIVLTSPMVNVSWNNADFGNILYKWIQSLLIRRDS